jgi:hypothetical protein
VLSDLANDKYGELIALADCILTVARMESEKGFEACPVGASIGALTQLPAPAFGAVFLTRQPICEDAGGMCDVSRINRLEAVARVSHRHFAPARVSFATDSNLALSLG